MREQLLAAIKAHAQGEIAKHKVNVKVYLEHPVGIGEHPDIIAALDEQVTLYTDALEKWNTVNNEFDIDPTQEDWDAR